jgi:hypothetical protein
MSDDFRPVLLEALRAARSGVEPPSEIAKAISSGGRELTIEELGLDSLGWMEFCISVELQTKLELTPTEIAGMRQVSEIEEWLRARA